MIKQDLIKAMINQQDLPFIGKNQLQKIIEKHPYFQSAYLLLAKKANNKNAYDKEVILAKAAAYAGDRTILYKAYKNVLEEEEQLSTTHLPKGVIEEKISATKSNLGESEDEALIQKSEAQLNRAIKQRTNELKKEDTASYEFNYEEQLRSMVRQDTPTEEIEIDRQRFFEKAKQQVDQELAQNIVLKGDKNKKTQLDTEDISAIIQQEAKELIAKAEADDDVEKLKAELGLTVVDETEGVLDIDENQSTEEQGYLMKDLKKKVEAFKRKKQFDNWLSGKKTDKNKDVAAANISGIKDEDLKAYLAEQKKHKNNTDLSLGQEDKQSLQDTSNFISETMAKVFARQGQYERAIRIYQQLNLKYPEKNAYFAAKIKELKSKL